MRLLRKCLLRLPFLLLLVTWFRTLLFPRQLGAWLSLATARMLRGQLNEAEIAANRALQLADEQLAQSHRTLAWVLELRGEPKTARRHLMLAGEAASHRTWDGEHHLAIWLGRLYEGDFEEAEELYRVHRQIQQRVADRLDPLPEPTRFLRGVWAAAIGHITHLDTYVKAGLLGYRKPHRTVLLARPEEVANPYYLSLWSKHVDVVTNPDEIERLQPQAVAHEDYMYMLDMGKECAWLPLALARVEREWEVQGAGPLLEMPPEDVKRGWKALYGQGLQPGDWFVCLHVRDPGYRESERGEHSVRDADIGTYGAAIRTIVERGGWVIRMGDPSAIPMTPQERVIDYAHSSFRSDWMDVFLCANAKFLVGTQSGLGQVPHTFGTPTLFTNWVSLAVPPWSTRNLFIPKRFWDERGGRFLTVDEVLRRGLGAAQHARRFEEQRVRLVPNTPEEIREVVVEMFDEVDGIERSCPEADRLQQRYRELVEEEHGYLANGRIGSAYLREHAALLLQKPAPARSRSLNPK